MKPQKAEIPYKKIAAVKTTIAFPPISEATTVDTKENEESFLSEIRKLSLVCFLAANRPIKRIITK